jgi:Fic family protein
VAEVSAEATDTARRILALREQHRSAITGELGRAAGNGHRVLESLFDRPIVSVAQVAELTRTSYAAANTLVARLVALGILDEVTGFARNRRFRYEPFVRLFTEESDEAAE